MLVRADGRHLERACLRRQVVEGTIHLSLIDVMGDGHVRVIVERRNPLQRTGSDDPLDLLTLTDAACDLDKDHRRYGAERSSAAQEHRERPVSYTHLRAHE